MNQADRQKILTQLLSESLEGIKGEAPKAQPSKRPAGKTDGRAGGHPRIDLTGRRQGSLIILERISAGRRPRWKCKCDCGLVFTTDTGTLNGSRNKQGSRQCKFCSKKQKANLRHGLSRSRSYKIWSNMVQRTNNPKCPCYYRYGGRGIFLCERWLKFENFLEDMGESPDGMTLERIDNEGPYSPENCKWASLIEQAYNKSDTPVVLVNGKWVNVMEASEFIGITKGGVWSRIQKGKLITKRLYDNKKPRIN